MDGWSEEWFIAVASGDISVLFGNLHPNISAVYEIYITFGAVVASIIVYFRASYHVLVVRVLLPDNDFEFGRLLYRDRDFICCIVYYNNAFDNSYFSNG